jgi:hypothetical protein
MNRPVILTLLLALPALGAVSGCSEEESTPAPSITEFRASPAVIALGEQVTLAWSVGGADTVTIIDGSNEWAPLDASGALEVLPASSTTYVLTAKGAGGTSTQAVDVTIDSILDPVPPEIEVFSATPGEVDPGASAALSWRVSAATSIAIEGGETPIDVGEGFEGEATVSPAQTTTWTLTATGPGGEVTGEAVLTVRNPGITSFSADPPSAPAGGEITLTWATEFATSLALDPPAGDTALALSGSVTVAPDAGTTTYTLTAFSDLPGAPDAVEAIDVTIHAVPEITQFEVDPDTARTGALTALYWQTTGATEVELTPVPPGITVDPAGVNQPDGLSFLAAESTTYTLVATGPGGRAEAEASLTVNQPPTVDRFEVEPTDIAIGGEATLRWTTSEADTIEIEPLQPDEPFEASGSLAVSPAETTTYRITATGPGGEETAEATLTVHGPPEILSFQADRQVIGPGQQVVLSWQVNENTESVSLEPDPEALFASTVPGGRFSVQPFESVTYTLTATGPGGEVSADARITVFPEPIILSFEADDDRARANGDPVVLSWETQNAHTVRFEPDIGVAEELVDGSSEPLFPETTTTYELTAFGSGGEVTSQVRVTVHRVPSIRDLGLAPDRVRLGGESTLSWEVVGARRVWFDPGPAIEELEIRGQRVVAPETTEVYTLHAESRGGTDEASATLTVHQPPEVLRFDADPVDILVGGSSTIQWELANAAALTITGPDGEVDLGEEEVGQGSVVVAPLDDGTFTYTLNVSGPGGELEVPLEISIRVRAAVLKVSEVMFSPVGPNRGLQWVEIYNPSDVEVPLDGYSLGMGSLDWTRPAVGLRGSITPGGCRVIGGPESNDNNANPELYQSVEFLPLLDDDPLGVVAIGLFFRTRFEIPQNDLTLVPLDAMLYGKGNGRGFLSSAGVQSRVHAVIWELDDDGRLAQDEGGDPIPTIEEGQSVARVSAGGEEWLVGGAPTPGDCFPGFDLAAVVPDEGPDADGVAVDVHGAGFSDGATFRFGADLADCVVARSDLARCTLLASGAGPGTVSLTVTLGEDEEILEDGYTYTGLDPNLGWCQIQHPIEAAAAAAGEASEQLFGRAYSQGLTEGDGQAEGLGSQVGYGPAGSNPEAEGGWWWSDGAYNGDLANEGEELNDDEHVATLNVDVAGTYSWAYRFSLDGLNWLYCDLPPGNDGADGGFAAENAGTLTIE